VYKVQLVSSARTPGYGTIYTLAPVKLNITPYIRYRKK
jgi:hypothetical protein